jgi:hypothetical protein
MAKDIIVAILRPTDRKHDIYFVDHEGHMTDKPIQCEYKDFAKTLFGLAKDKSIETVKLYGTRDYVSGIKDQLEKKLKTEYQNLKINISIGQ